MKIKPGALFQIGMVIGFYGWVLLIIFLEKN